MCDKITCIQSDDRRRIVTLLIARPHGHETEMPVFVAAVFVEIVRVLFFLQFAGNQSVYQSRGVIASETTENNTGSQITLRNNVLANAVVAGCLFWGVGKANESSQQRDRRLCRSRANPECESADRPCRNRNPAC